MNYDFRNERKLILELLRRCPFGIALSNCPAKEIRELSSLEKFKIVGSMSKQELDKILGYHEKCSQKRKNDKITNKD